MISMDLIEATFRRINSTYRPGLIRWIKEGQDRWARLLILEDRINDAALAGNEVELIGVLSEYLAFFGESLEEYRKGDTLNLFGKRGVYDRS